jgi:hypothetical protein
MPHPAPIACRACRRSHLRCDAKSPICSRCLGANLQCNYTPSRRGIRKSVPGSIQPSTLSSAAHLIRSPSGSPPIRTIYPQQTQRTNGRTPVYSTPQWSGNVSSTEDDDLSRESFDMAVAHVYPPVSADGHQFPRPALKLQTPPPTDTHDDHLVNLFYTYFQPAHPILFPGSLYASQIYPVYLRHVVHFIGSQYSSSVCSDSLGAIAATGQGFDGPKTPLMVQARLLYAIALHGLNELGGFQSNLNQSIKDALELGMNEEGSPAAYGRQNLLEEESMRRTWWELYVIEGYMAAFWQKPDLSTCGINMDISLPCDEQIYNEGQVIPKPPSLDQFSQRLFADEEVKYSSFCYRIEAIRILNRVLTLTRTKDMHRGKV